MLSTILAAVFITGPGATTCDKDLIEVARAGLVLFRDPDAVADARKMVIGTIGAAFEEGEIRSNEMPPCRSELATAVGMLPLEITSSVTEKDAEGRLLPAVLLEALAKSKASERFAIRRNSVCANTQISSKGCTPYVAQELVWRGDLKKIPDIAKETASNDAEYWQRVRPLLAKWQDLLRKQPSRIAAIRIALSDETLRDWTLDEIFGPRNARSWEIDGVAVAVVAAREQEEREARRIRQHELDNAAKGVLEVTATQDGDPCVPPDLPCAVLLRAGPRIGWANAAELLHSKLHDPSGFRNGQIQVGSYGGSPPWEHFPGEFKVYRAEWTGTGNVPEEYLRKRWLETDRAAPKFDLPLIQKRIEKIQGSQP